MPLITPKTERKHRSDASMLHKQYSLLVVDNSTVLDFQTLINKGISVQSIRIVISAIAKLPQNRRPGSRGLVRRWTHWQEYARDTLEGYAITDKATLLANRIAEDAEPIPVEYVQHTLDTYSDFLTKVNGIDKSVWEALPPANEFVLYWYIKLCHKYSHDYRKFRLDHDRFIEYGQKLLRGYSGNPKRWNEIVEAVKCQK
jgi:hypothetical protein